MGVEKTVTGPMENVSFEQSAANEIVVNDGVIRFLFVIDNANRILSKYEYFNNSVIKYQYTYDDDGRLSNVRMNDELVEEYFYDGKGRRVSDYNYFRAQNKRDYKYDSRGQLKKAGDIIFKYDNAGRLLLRQDRKKKMKFSYNGYGLIATAKISSEGKALEPIKYSYDRNGRRVGVSCGDDLITSYEWDGNRIKNMVDGSWWSFDYENDSVLPISFEKNGEKYFPSYDNVGTLRALVDQRGELVWSVLYDSFGNVIYEKDQDFGVPFGFAGGVRDEYTGFCHFLLREYDSEIARWNRIDPLGYAAGDIDLYGYCLDDPINLRDVAGAKVTFGKIMAGGIEGTSFGFGFGFGLAGPYGALAGTMLGAPLGLLKPFLKDSTPNPDDEIDKFLEKRRTPDLRGGYKTLPGSPNDKGELVNLPHPRSKKRQASEGPTGGDVIWGMLKKGGSAFVEGTLRKGVPYGVAQGLSKAPQGGVEAIIGNYQGGPAAIFDRYYNEQMEKRKKSAPKSK